MSHKTLALVASSSWPWYFWRNLSCWVVSYSMGPVCCTAPIASLSNRSRYGTLSSKECNPAFQQRLSS